MPLESFLSPAKSSWVLRVGRRLWRRLKGLPTAGKVGPHRESHINLPAHEYLTVKPVTGNLSWSRSWGIKNWGMDYNDVLGDCGFAAWDHYNISKTGKTSLLNKTWLPKYQTTRDAYFAYGIAQGEPGPNPDQGVDNATMLAWGYKNGFIDGYAEVPLEYLDWFGKHFDGILLGCALDGNQAISDFNHGVAWPPMAQIDGHDILCIGGTVSGSKVAVTWGGTIGLTKGFCSNNITDAWVILDKNDPRVNWPKLQADLKVIHGTP